jgi:ketosteroid isomerase-like protein
MRRLGPAGSLSCLLLLAAACAVPVTPETRREQIESLRAGLVAAAGVPDQEALLGLFTPDAILLGLDESPISGDEALRSWLRPLLDRRRLALSPEEVEISGDLALERGSFEAGAVPLSGGPPAESRGSYILILRWQPEGGWKIARALTTGGRPLVAAAGVRRPPGAGARGAAAREVGAPWPWATPGLEVSPAPAPPPDPEPARPPSPR